MERKVRHTSTPQGSVIVLGRFPPPFDGQSVATEQLCNLIAPAWRVIRVNTEPPAGDILHTDVRFTWSRFRHHAGRRRRIAAQMERFPGAPVLWTAISAMPLGHWRDVLTTLPAIPRTHPIYGVLHRATFHHLFAHPTTRATARALVRRLAGFVFLDASIAEKSASYVPSEKRWVIPNTVQEALVASEAELEERRARVRNPLRLLFLSNMMPEKGFADLLDALPQAVASGLNVEAHFVGSWTKPGQEAAFAQRIQALGLSGKAIHHGPCHDRDGVRRLLLAADAFVLPTWHPTEAQPLTIIEAFATGTPVVTTQQGGIPEMMAEGVEGFFVPAHNPAAMVASFEKLMVPDVWQAASAAARTRFDRQFHPNVVRQRWLALLDGTLSNS